MAKMLCRPTPPISRFSAISKVHRVAALCAALIVFAWPGESHARCMSTQEANAEHVRGLQSALMVAALKCVHRPELKSFERYNSIITQFDRELIAHSNVLQAYFRRVYGSKHRYHINKYVTRLANDFSLRTFETPSFCDEMSDIANTILADGEGSILHLRFDRSFLPPNSANLCASKKSRDFPALNGTVPDLVSIHMPDLDKPAKSKQVLDPSVVPPMPAE